MFCLTPLLDVQVHVYVLPGWRRLGEHFDWLAFLRGVEHSLHFRSRAERLGADHIHVTGVPEERPRAVSLHLYGRTMSDFNIYDLPSRSRRRIAVAHNES